MTFFFPQEIVIYSQGQDETHQLFKGHYYTKIVVHVVKIQLLAPQRRRPTYEGAVANLCHTWSDTNDNDRSSSMSTVTIREIISEVATDLQVAPKKRRREDP